MYYRNRKGIKIWSLQKRNKFGCLNTFKNKGVINFPFDMPDGEFDCMVIMPSKKRLARNFAKQINEKYNIPVLDKNTLKKQGRISIIPINLRHMKAESMFKSKVVSGKILLIDDYSTTGASMVSAAKELLKNGAESVTGFCVVIN
jgi:phosphoribosylpyrophosphate synthetase